MKKLFTAESGFTGAIIIAAALVHPLVWVAAVRPTAFYGDFQLFAAPVFTWLMLMAAVGCGGRINAAFREGVWRDRVPLVLAVLLLLTEVIRQLFGCPAEFYPGNFIPAAYLAGVAIAPAWKKLSPIILGGAGVILVIFTALTAHNYGFFGNWNWSATLTVAALPATVALFYRGRHRLLISGAAIGLFLILITFRDAETLPRGTILALLVTLPLAWKLTQEKPDRRYIMAIGVPALLIILVAAAIFLGGAAILDYRIQLYRGTCRLIGDHWLFGCGAERYEELIGVYLPRLYHFVRFTAERHTHPHNEVLYMLISYGVLGAVFLFAALGRAAKNFAAEKSAEAYLLWVVLLLFFHGQLDVLLAEPAIGALFWVTLGALGTPDEVAAPTPKPAKIVAVFLALFFYIAAFRTGFATWHFRAAKLTPTEAETRLEISLKTQVRRESLYLLAVEKFNRGDLAGAEAELKRLHRISPLGYVHSYGLLARILAARGERGEAAFAFGVEDRRFPYSALNAYYYWIFCREIGAVPEQQEAAKQHLLNCLKLRKLSEADLPEFILRHSEWDDLPLELQQLAPGGSAPGKLD